MEQIGQIGMSKEMAILGQLGRNKGRSMIKEISSWES